MHNILKQVLRPTSYFLTGNKPKDHLLDYLEKIPIKWMSFEFGVGDEDIFDWSATNTTEQDDELTAISDFLPEDAGWLAGRIECIEAVLENSTPREFAFRLGFSGGGQELIANTRCDALGDDIGRQLIAHHTALHMRGDPNANWSVLTSGKWRVTLLYVDYGAL